MREMLQSVDGYISVAEIEDAIANSGLNLPNNVFAMLQQRCAWDGSSIS